MRQELFNTNSFTSSHTLDIKITDKNPVFNYSIKDKFGKETDKAVNQVEAGNFYNDEVIDRELKNLAYKIKFIYPPQIRAYPQTVQSR